MGSIKRELYDECMITSPVIADVATTTSITTVITGKIGFLHGVLECCCFYFMWAAMAPQIAMIVIGLFHDFFICIFDLIGAGNVLSSTTTKIQTGALVDVFLTTMYEFRDGCGFDATPNS